MNAYLRGVRENQRISLVAGNGCPSWPNKSKDCKGMKVALTRPIATEEDYFDLGTVMTITGVYRGTLQLRHGDRRVWGVRFDEIKLEEEK